MSDATLPVSWSDEASAEGVLQTLLRISLTGIMLLRPVYNATGTTIVDFAWVQLNPAAQQILRLPAYPTGSLLTLFPTAQQANVFGFYRQTFLSGQVERLQNNDQQDGLDGCYLLVAQRHEQLLLVSFTDTNDQPRSAAEEALRQSQAREQETRAQVELQRQRLHQVLMQLPANIALLHGPEYSFELLNSHYQALFPGRELLGHSIREALPQLAGQGFFEAMDHVYHTREPVYLPEAAAWADFASAGQLAQRYYSVSLLPFQDAQGQVTGLLNVAFDVTAQVAARQQAQQLSQELEARVQQRTQQLQVARATTERQRVRLERLFQEAPAAICMLSGPELVYELVNPVYQRFFPERHLVDKPLREALPELTEHEAYYTMKQVFDTGVTHWEQALHTPLARTSDGKLEDRYFNYIQQARYDEQGHIDGVLVFGFEVTELVQAQQASEALARQLRLLTDALPALIGYLDRGHRYQFANEAYRTWFDQDPAALLGRPVREVVGEAAYAATQGYIARALAGERLEFDAHMPYRDGFSRTIHTNYIPDVRQGEVLGFYTLVTDVTEQTLAREQVQDLNQQLAASNEKLHVLNAELVETNRQLTRTNVDLDTFVYTASHDLKAPITNIESIVLALRDTLPQPVQQDELVAHLLGLLDTTVARFQATIAQLTDISRLQLAHTGPAEPVRLAAVVEDVRLDLAPLLAAAGTRLTVELAPELVVSFSPANLRSIVYNLLSNAVKYRAVDRPSQVLVRAAQTGATIVLTVQDNGLGMSEVQQRQLFGLFQRLHTHVEGTGVGLYITKRLVENAGGTITVRSQADAGATFTVTFPA